MNFEITQLSQESWVGYLKCEGEVFLSIFTYVEERAFSLLAEFLMQLGSYNFTGEMPSCMLDRDQIFFPDSE